MISRGVNILYGKYISLSFPKWGENVRGVEGVGSPTSF
jgi:hypothetical protein